MADKHTNPITQCAANADPIFKFNGRDVHVSAHGNHSDPKVQAFLNSCFAVAPVASQSLGGMALGGVAGDGLGAALGAFIPLVYRTLGKPEVKGPVKT